MEFYNATGVTETPEISLFKGFGSLVVATSSDFSAIQNETITFYVQKSNGNKYIAHDMLLRDFMLLGTFGEDALQSDATFQTIAKIELTKDGGFIDLKENEVIKVKLRNLTALTTYKMNGMEEPVPSAELFMYVRKTMATETLNQEFDVKGYDLLSLTNDASISEVQITFDNHHVVKTDVFELLTSMRSLDPLYYVKQNGNVAQVPTNRILIPLKGVLKVSISKDATAMLNLSMRIDESDYALYQMENDAIK